VSRGEVAVRAGQPFPEAVLFDLGNTLVAYWERTEWPEVLHSGIEGAMRFLEREGRLHVSADTVWERVEDHQHELPGHRVYPLQERLAGIFGLPREGEALLSEACRHFLAPMFARGRPYVDVPPTLAALRDAGIKTAIVSNSPWGSPAVLWREEIERLGLRQQVDADVFCGDVGWRKPARPIFGLALHRLGVAPKRCVFVGDDPRWDLAGPRALGMRALLIDRTGRSAYADECPIRCLHELWERFGRDAARR
jgi:putative hydrolase of the HAD superfamily